MDHAGFRGRLDLRVWKLLRGVRSLKCAKELAHVRHVKPDFVILDQEDPLPVSGPRADLNSRVRAEGRKLPGLLEEILKQNVQGGP